MTTSHAGTREWKERLAGPERRYWLDHLRRLLEKHEGHARPVCEALDLPRRNLYLWVKKDPELAAIVDACRDAGQEKRTAARVAARAARSKTHRAPRPIAGIVVGLDGIARLAGKPAADAPTMPEAGPEDTGRPEATPGTMGALDGG